MGADADANADTDKRQVKKIKLRPDVLEALWDFNMQRKGRGIESNGYIDDPEVLDRLVSMAKPGEDLNDTILRVLSGNISLRQH